MIRLTLVCLFFSILEHGGNNLRQVDELMICGICIVFGKKVKVLLLSSTRQAAIVTACPYCNYQEKFAYCSFCMNVHRSNNLYKRLTFLLFDDIFIIERLIMLQTDSASSCKYSTTFFCFSFLLKSICILFLNSVLLLRMRFGTSLTCRIFERHTRASRPLHFSPEKRVQLLLSLSPKRESGSEMIFLS